MIGSKKRNVVQITRQNISYYDEIALNYDAILNEDGSNTIIRDKVAAEFTSLVKGGSILDFGGGTGRDMGWLIQHHYRITFCEPSTAMRQIAIDRRKSEFPDSSISFFNDNETDFRSWNSIFPFEEKVNAILANFAVINCIPDIEFLFEKLALAIKPGGIILALMLENSLTKRLRSNLKGSLMSFISGNPLSITIDYNGKRQLVYIHSNRAIKKALANNFEFNHLERLREFGFCLIHLVRK